MGSRLIKVLQMDHAKGLPLPTYATKGSAGMDLYAAQQVYVASRQTKLVRTGLKIEIPLGYEGQIRSRSGLALYNGIFVLNAPATIDSDYRGELKIILMNLGQDPYLVGRGERIAQLVIKRVERFQLLSVNSLNETERGDGGFGSTGVK